MKSKKQRQSEALSRWYERKRTLEAELRRLLAVPKEAVTPEIAEQALYAQGRIEVAKREIGNLEAKGVKI